MLYCIIVDGLIWICDKNYVLSCVFWLRNIDMCYVIKEKLVIENERLKSGNKIINIIIMGEYWG